MKASDSTPCEGESADDAECTNQAAQELLAKQLVRIADDVDEAIHSSAIAAEKGEFSKAELSSLWTVLDEFEETVDLAEQIVLGEGNVMAEGADAGGATDE